MVRGCEAWKLFVPQVENYSIPDTQPIPKSNIFQIIWQKFKKGRKKLIYFDFFYQEIIRQQQEAQKGFRTPSPQSE